MLPRLPRPRHVRNCHHERTGSRLPGPTVVQDWEGQTVRRDPSKRIGWHPWRDAPLLSRLLLLILLPMVGMVLGVQHFRSGAQAPEGPIWLEGPAGRIVIQRDTFGVPRIRAAHDRDVFFATGYVHAQDRLWQLELQRRIANGRLSELFGASMLERDIWMRTLGLRPAAQAAFAALSPQARDALTAYAEGINAWLKTHPQRPLEFLAAGVEPEPWTPIDSLAWSKVFALSLASNSDRELQRLAAGPLLTGPQLKSFFPLSQVDSDRGGLSSAVAQSLGAQIDLSRASTKASGLGGRYAGSNGWVLAGRWTVDGQAILANDPHLGLQMPSLWYVLSQHGDQLRSSGMSIVGLPMVVFGKNDHIAWGGVSMMADVQDLFVEQVQTAGDPVFRMDGQWVPLETRTEWITVSAPFPAFLRGALQPVRLDVRKTINGPLISESISGLQQMLSLRWTALDPDDTSVDALLRLNYAQNWDQFNAALQRHVAPALVFLFADQAGNIGSVGAGRLPMRGLGQGLDPNAGWDSSQRWRGHVPFDEMPREFNPPRGYIVQANQALRTTGRQHFISQDWAPPSRAQRIEQVIQQSIRADRKLSLDAMAELQRDLVSLPAVKLKELLLRRIGSAPDERAARALDLLRPWQGEMAMDSVAASIFQVWTDHLRTGLFHRVVTARLGQKERQQRLSALAEETSLDDLQRILQDQDNPWCTDTQRGADLPACDAVIQQALQDALQQLRRVAGSDVDDWAWGRIHRAVYDHALFSEIEFMDRLFGRRVATGGSPDTVNVANSTFALGDGYLQTFGASFRQLIQMGTEPRQRFGNSTGQSGDIFSPHYDDLLAHFHEGPLLELAPRPVGGLHTSCLMPLASRPATMTTSAPPGPGDICGNEEPVR